MKQERFNALPLKQQAKFIRQQLRGQKPGFINCLAFKNKCIYYIIKPSGGLRKALMQPLPEELPIPNLMELLKDSHTYNICMDQQMGISDLIYNILSPNN
jgi:hypothetical protein